MLTKSLLTSVVFFAVSAFGNDSNYLFNSEKFPKNAAIPTLANGNLGFVVHSDSVFLSGVYNGMANQSHRARIPNYARLQLPECSYEEAEESPNCSYQLDIRFGRFRTIYNDPNGQMRLIHEVYPHRFFQHAIINRVRIQRLNGEGTLMARIVQNPGVPSEDIVFEPTQAQDINGQTVWYMCGQTNQVEDFFFQTAGSRVCVFYKNSQVTYLVLDGDRTSQDYYFYTVFARNETVGADEMKLLMSADIEQTHLVQMNALWDRYDIVVEGNDELDRAIKASSFALFSNVQSLASSQPGVFEGYGISPSGIGRGGGSSPGFQGHNQWDMEMWIFPVLLLIDPRAARELLQYRSATIRRSLEANAADQGFEGWKYPWSSAYTGSEVSSSEEAVTLQHHITADVAFAARQYLFATSDLDWMETNGCELAYQTAKFWKSRATYNADRDKFDIRFVIGPDELNRNVYNDVFTNVVAAHNLFFGEFAACMCRSSLKLVNEDEKEFLKVAKSLQLLYDEGTDYHPQFDRYIVGAEIGQADAVLLIYPLAFPMDDSTKKRNLEVYEKATVQNGPAMTWPIHTIGWLELGEKERAATLLEKSYREYLRPPFSVWNKMPLDFAEGSNFVTGAGGFLQSILNGYGGIRLSNDSFEIRNPTLPPATSRLYIPEINYLTSRFSLEILPDKFAVIFKPGSANTALKLFVDDDSGREMCDSCGAYATRSIRLQQILPEGSANECTLKTTTMNMRLEDQDDGAASVMTSVRLIVATIVVGYTIRKWMYAF
ncbi:protein-glucosylgalactosylhydroxylysine glucosidase-like [Sabethes cyaneus]|uniref:protein-glucosylgalactosylhydroxylysine glucosidase-like n=1 Tax=Sabethes cyaneus TaxID=53552 RepID=UPI00237DDC07|nr:protein-glucosylgalactosylhydroxylysine glucosidase-like [Sabethes cyaneus]